MSREVLQQALDRLEWFVDSYPHDITISKDEFLRPIKEALAQPVILVTEIHLTPEQRESLRCKTDVAIPEFALPAQQDAETNLQAVSDFGQLQAQPDERDRCTHGVWIADHCYKCAASQPAQEPVAWIDDNGNLHRDEPPYSYGPDPRPLYATPPQRQPLTDDEIKAIQYSDPVFMTCSCPAFARAIESAHNIGDKT